MRNALPLLLVAFLAAGHCPAAGGESVVRVSGKTARRVVKLVPEIRVLTTDGKIYLAREVRRDGKKLRVTLAGGGKVVLPLSVVKRVYRGHVRTTKGISYGKYSRGSKNISGLKPARVFDRNGAWKSFGGAAHWSDSYGNGRSVKR